jgi:hypothetical protein
MNFYLWRVNFNFYPFFDPSHSLSVAAYFVLLVSGVGTVQEVDGDLVVLVEPLHHERLEPPGTDVMIFEIISLKNLAKNLAFLHSNYC